MLPLSSEKYKSGRQDMIVELLIFFIIFFFASTISIFIFSKFKLNVYASVIICLVLTILFMNLFFISPLPKGKTGEFYEIFWLFPPVFVLVICKILDRRKRAKWML